MSLTKIAAVLVGLYAAVVFGVWLMQRKLIYVPTATRVAPASLGLTGIAEITIRTPDGAELVAWRAQAKPGLPTLLYFHGNAGNLATRADRAQRYERLGFGLLMLSYRSYSGSTGQPTETTNVADALLAYDRLIGEGVKGGDIVLYGESLGSGVAVQVAAQRPVRAIVLDAPYTSLIAMAQKTYPFLPVRPLIADRYESDKAIGKVRAPLLVLHGAKDELIPVTMGQALFAMANEPKKIVVYPNGLHTDLDDHGAVDDVRAFVLANTAQ